MDNAPKKNQGNHQARKQQSGTLTIWQWNADGFQKKKAQLQQYIQAEDAPDVIIVQETLCSEAPTLPGYR
ncbi:hypothetical protein HPB50_028520 [Hyalomma asiaticum]|nr:hypothetical protein HPB50_028520 [Hyalomma asiaticum]